MQRFILEQNVAHFEKLLCGPADGGLRRTLQTLLLSAQRQLAVLNSEKSGLQRTDVVARASKAPEDVAQIYPEFEGSPHPYLVLDPGPGLHIVDINDAYARATFTKRNEIVGKSLFEVFPDNPDDEMADGVRNLYASLRAVAETRKPNAMRVQRYDVRDTTGRFVERYWQPINTPIHDEQRNLIYILHHVEDVTIEFLSQSFCGSCSTASGGASPGG